MHGCGSGLQAARTKMVQLVCALPNEWLLFATHTTLPYLGRGAPRLRFETKEVRSERPQASYHARKVVAGSSESRTLLQQTGGSIGRVGFCAEGDEKRVCSAHASQLICALNDRVLER